jgi:hypothetical protein
MANDFEIEVLKQLGEIKADLATNTQATIDLSGPLGRVTSLEDASKRHEQRQWIHTVVIIPLLALGHTALRKLGLDV